VRSSRRRSGLGVLLAVGARADGGDTGGVAWGEHDPTFGCAESAGVYHRELSRIEEGRLKGGRSLSGFPARFAETQASGETRGEPENPGSLRSLHDPHRVCRSGGGTLP